VENLPPKGEHYTYSVICKLIILPSDKPVRVSRIYKNDLNPEIEEDFEFAIKHPRGKVLRLSLYDADHQGKYDAIGHALFYLEDVLSGQSRKYAMRLYKQSQVSNCPLCCHVSRNVDSNLSAMYHNEHSLPAYSTLPSTACHSTKCTAHIISTKLAHLMLLCTQ